MHIAPETGLHAVASVPAPRQAARLAGVDIAIPVFNEERALPACVRTLHAFLSESFHLPWRITIVDNGSTDATWSVATELAALDGVRARRLTVRGKGAAVRAAWQDSPAEIVAYMDVDLSTGLAALLPLLAPLISGHSDVAVGTRLAYGAQVRRGLRREAVSRSYNMLLRHALGARFTDAACGFKAARAEAVRPLLAKVADDGWFFDTEMLLLAEHNALRIHEVPVDWVEDTDSHVKIVPTATHNLRGLLRVARTVVAGDARVAIPRPPPRMPRGGLVPLALIGLVSTAAQVLTYVTVRACCGPVTASLTALVVCAAAAAEAGRRWTFHPRGGAGARARLRSGALFLIHAFASSGAVLIAGPDPTAETIALAGVASLLAVRFRWTIAR